MFYRALEDIRFSINELRHYRDTVFKSREQYTSDMKERSGQARGLRRLLQHPYSILIVLLVFVSWLVATYLETYNGAFA